MPVRCACQPSVRKGNSGNAVPESTPLYGVRRCSAVLARVPDRLGTRAGVVSRSCLHIHTAHLVAKLSFPVRGGRFSIAPM